MKLKNSVFCIVIINMLIFCDSCAMQSRCTSQKIVITKRSNPFASTDNRLVKRMSISCIPEGKDSFVQGLNELMCSNIDRCQLKKCINNKRDRDVQARRYNRADLDEEDRNGMTPLIVAVRLDRADYVKVLFKSCADMNKATSNGNTPLKEACNYANDAMVKLLCTKKYKVAFNYADSLGVTALHVALNVIAEVGTEGRGYIIPIMKPIIKCLIENGANPELDSQPYGTAYQQAKQLKISNLLHISIDEN